MANQIFNFELIHINLFGQIMVFCWSLITHATRRYILTFWSLLVSLHDFKFHVKAVKKDFKKLLKLQEIVFEIIMMLIDCWLLMNITVYPTISEINTMIFVWVLTWLHFKFHSEIVCWNFTIWSLTSNEWILSEI